jgi:hypothetical protein
MEFSLTVFQEACGTFDACASSLGPRPPVRMHLVWAAPISGFDGELAGEARGRWVLHPRNRLSQRGPDHHLVGPGEPGLASHQAGACAG